MTVLPTAPVLIVCAATLVAYVALRVLHRRQPVAVRRAVRAFVRGLGYPLGILAAVPAFVLFAAVSTFYVLPIEALAALREARRS